MTADSEDTAGNKRDEVAAITDWHSRERLGHVLNGHIDHRN